MKNDYYGWVTLRQAVEERWDDKTSCWHNCEQGLVAPHTASLGTLRSIVVIDPTWRGGFNMMICRAMKPLPRSV